LPSHEVQTEYILGFVKHMQEDGIKAVQPKQNVTTQFNMRVDAWHQKNSIWAEDCKSWYKQNTTSGHVYLWPGSMLHILKFLKRPRIEHYDIEYRDPENIWAMLGNGMTIGEEKYGTKVPVPYIRLHEDDPWDIE
jgi:hypothetical protein